MKKIVILIFCLILSMNLTAADVEDLEYIKKLYSNKYYNEAISELQFFIKKYTDSPHYYSALNLLGSSYYALEKYSKAKTVFNTLTASEYKDNAHYYLALIAVRKKNYEDVDKNLNRIGKKSKLKSEALYRVASFFYKKEKYNKAEIYFKKTLPYKDKFSIESLKKLGFIYYKQKEYLKVSTVLEEYIKKVEESKDLPLVYYILGFSSEKDDNIENALKYYLYIERNFKDSEYFLKSILNAAKLFSRLNERKKLHTSVKKLEGTEYEKEALLILSEFEYENENFAEAELIYEKILKTEQTPKVRYKFILSLIKQKKYQKALKNLDKIRNTEYESEYYYYSGFIFHKQENYTKVLEKLIGIEKKNIKKEYLEDCYLFLAESGFNLEKFDISEKYYNELYSLKKDKKYLYHVFLSVYKLKDVTKAEITYGIYKKRFPEDRQYKKEIYSLLGELYVENGMYYKAEDIYKEYLKIEKDSIVLNNLVAVLLKQNKHKEMLKYLDKGEDSIENLYSKGLAFSGMHDYKNAVEIYKRILQKEKNEYIERSYRKLVEALYSMRNYKEIIKYASEYLSRDYKEYRKEILDKKGLAYFRLKKYEDAITVYEELKNYPEVQDYAYFMLGEIYYNKKDTHKAKASYGFVINNMPDSPYHRTSLYWYINILYQNQDDEETIKYINQFLKKYQEGEYVEEVISYLGDIYTAQGKVDKAAQAYEKLYHLARDEDAKENLAKSMIKIYFDRKDYDNSIQWLKKLKEEGFKNLWMGIIYEKQGKGKLAVESYNKIIDDPEYGDKAGYYLGSYYLKKKNYDTARKYLEPVADEEMSEYKDDALLKLGLSYEQENNPKQAISYFMKVKLLYENSPFQDIVTLKIAENYEKAGDIEKSIKNYKDFFNNYKNSKYYKRVAERLLVYYLNKENKEKARGYFEELKKLDETKAVKYEKYFQDK